MRRYFLISFIFIIIISNLLFASNRKNIAVLKFLNESKLLQDDEVKFIEETLRATASNILPKDKYLVYTNESLMELLRANEVNICDSEGECEVETMRKIQADFGITGQVLKFSDNIKVVMKIYDSISGNLLGTELLTGISSKEIEPQLEYASKKLIGRIYNLDSNEKVETLYQKGELGEIAINVSEDESYIFIDNKPFGLANKGQSYIVSLAPGEYEIRVYKLGFTDYNVKIKIDKKEKINKDILLKKLEEGAKKLGSSRISIEALPESGADIFFGKQNTNFKTPYTLKDIPPGKYDIILKRQFYHDQLLSIEVKEGDVRVERVNLKPKFGSLTIKSEPENATLLIAGKVMGTTPYNTQRLASGKYNIELQKPMYHSYSEEIIIKDGIKEEKLYKLKPAFGILNIDSKPTKTKVTIDGMERGVTPIENFILTSGEHFVTLESELYKPLNQNIRQGAKLGALTMGILKIY